MSWALPHKGGWGLLFDFHRNFVFLGCRGVCSLAMSLSLGCAAARTGVSLGLDDWWGSRPRGSSGCGFIFFFTRGLTMDGADDYAMGRIRHGGSPIPSRSSLSSQA
eukprot:GHVU01047542.1.p2 GENE.GHVU01047542.1~~GHVU01047542.1.p2  ORF type:complete len:106 (+),score=2.83 GHVU01047542.1:130-447(+)